MDWIFLLHVFFTFYMTGVIWFVQIVHYPLMAKVGSDHFKSYEQAHTMLTTWVVGPQMIIELASGIFLLWQNGNDAWYWANIALLAVIWSSTFFIQMSLHGRLTEGFQEELQQQLVQSNWLRTVAWTVRSAILIWLMI